MMGTKFGWTICLMICVTVGFYRSWKVEHESKSSTDYRKSTTIFISPLYFPVVVIGVFTIYVFMMGWKKGLLQFAFLSLEILLLMTIYDVVLIIAMPLMRKYFSARVCASLWIVPAFIFLIQIFDRYKSQDNINLLLVPPLGEKLSFAVLVWILVSAFLIMSGIVKRVLFYKKLSKHSSKNENYERIQLLEDVSKEIGTTQNIQIRVSELISSPLTIKRWNGYILFLPPKSYSEQELKMIFRHELRHIQRKDQDTKIYLAFCKAFLWFNPLIWIAAEKATEDLELSCDEVVLQNASLKEREEYSHLLIETSSNATGFPTHLSVNSKFLQYRINNVLNPKKRYLGVILLAVVILTSCMATGNIAFAEPECMLSGEIQTDHLAEIVIYQEDEEPIYLKEDKDIHKYYIQHYEDLRVRKLCTTASYDMSAYPMTQLYFANTQETMHVAISGNMVKITKIYMDDDNPDHKQVDNFYYSIVK